MKAQVALAAVLGALFVVLFTTLLVSSRISEFTYASLMLAFALICLGLVVLPRLRELDLKNLRLTLDEIRRVKAEVQEVKDEITGMYGSIESLRGQPLVLDNAKLRELGLETSVFFITPKGVVRYVAGCMKRERERLAMVFVKEKCPEDIAEGILDGSRDDRVFKFNGPEDTLEAQPTSADDRKKPMRNQQEQKK